MAVYSYSKEHGRNLTSIMNAKEGDTITLSTGSYAYTQPQDRFGWRGSQWTNYTLGPCLGQKEFCDNLFDIEDIGQCPLDDSFQNEKTRHAAEAWWSEEVRKGTYGKKVK
jgi:hypothetical protein